MAVGLNTFTEGSFAIRRFVTVMLKKSFDLNFSYCFDAVTPTLSGKSILAVFSLQANRDFRGVRLE